MKYILVLLTMIISLSSNAQKCNCKCDTIPPLPTTWKFKNKILTPKIVSGDYHHYMVFTMKGDSSTGFHNMYIGSIVRKDSTESGQNVNHVPYSGYRTDPDVLLRMASEYKDSCEARAAFWRMVKHHPKHV